jgi:hypothetical protein
VAFSPVDPSSLQGEALNRWYLRSPDEIEQERQAAHAQKYNTFFGGTEPMEPAATSPVPAYQGSGAAIRDDPTWAAYGPNRWQRQDQSTSGPTSDPQSRPFQLATSSQPAATPGILNCPTCHGRVPPPLPFPFPFLPGGPFFRDTPSAPSGGGSPRRRFPQCGIQYENDSEICGGLPTPAARGRCWPSASERQAYCLSHDGEVGWPKLQTR